MGSGRLASSDAYDGAQRLFDPGLSPSANLPTRTDQAPVSAAKFPLISKRFAGFEFTSETGQGR